MTLFSESSEIFQKNKNITQQISELKKQILYYQKEYYENNTSKISDTEFDALFHELKNLEKQYPKYLTNDSPTQKIYTTQQIALIKSKHLVPMISLENAFQNSDLFDWEERFLKILEKQEITFPKNAEPKYIVEPKFDGLGISCVYENGKFARAVTRGNGEEGETVSQNVQTITDYKANISKISEDNNFDIFEIRGEIVMKKSVFTELNVSLEKEGKKTFSTPRNAAAGSLRQLDSNITRERKLSIFFYETPLTTAHSQFKTYSNTLKFFDEQNISYCKDYYACNSITEVISAIKNIADMRENFDFDIDGAVIKVNNYKLREKIGVTGHHPRWAIAWKFPAIQVQTILESIEWQVGRTGVLTPVAYLKDVMIDGVKINRATLHNADYIEEKKLNIGDTILLERSGDVIPKILKSITTENKENNTGKEIKSEILIPNFCPVCESPTVKKTEEVALRCSNSNCPQILKGKLEHFVSKKCLNIKGLGTEVCDDLIEKKLIIHFADFSKIYTFTEKDWSEIKNFKLKSIKNVQSALEKSKTQPFWRIIHAMGISGVGEKTSKTIATHYENFLAFSHISERSLENLQNIEDIGEKTAQEIINFVENAEHQNLFIQLENIFQTNIQKSTINNNDSHIFSSLLENKKFVITGSFENYSRDSLKEIIENNGGSCMSAVSKKTDFVLAGEKAGSKKTKAEDLGVEILELQQFLELVGL
ncbi:TPA: NAD-dependent DNA ligase LigA [Candidatus Gracilibacteria bacterium]|nr:NAD-dependent DNA ligase LigA [Candidatus Gracilibacteria bacterium]HIQ57770.1 NAD-dependent DNA ligase LigA [Candidatus Gracilibacteria bacterium]